MNIQTVGVVGLGFLGRGIATCLLAHDLNVIAFDQNPATRHAARTHIAQALAEMQQRGILADSVLTQWPDRYIDAQSLSELATCDFVIESVIENLDVKQTLLKELEQFLSASVPIGSNTSAIPITRLQLECRSPERILGMHWAEPCHLTRFLELIRGEKTNAATLSAARDLGIQLGKEPALVQKDVPGFIVNRLGYAMYREAFWLLENGVADVETIDRAFRNALSVWAEIAGPFRWMDLTGLPAYASVMEHLFPALSRATEVPRTMRALVESGAQGITNGRGFYEYSEADKADWERRLNENVWRQIPGSVSTSPAGSVESP